MGKGDVQSLQVSESGARRLLWCLCMNKEKGGQTYPRFSGCILCATIFLIFFQTITHLILTTTLGSRRYHIHFTDEENEAQRG